jgi:purine-binding chemotaxis protein CheW
MTELYVVFSVAGAEYAISASLVKQLESYQGATRVPGAAAHVAGVIQVRGQVIPVVDMRQYFGQPSVEPSLDTRVVVIELGERRVGLIVDKSREVLRVDPSSIQTTPGLMERNARGLFFGLVQLGPRMLILLDVRKVVGEEDLNGESPKRLEPGFHDPAKLPGHTAPGAPGNDDGPRPGH